MKDIKEMTLAQERVYKAIQKHEPDKKRAPSFSELAEATGFSVPSIQWHLGIMVSNGWVSYNKGEARTIVIVEPDAA